MRGRQWKREIAARYSLLAQVPGAMIPTPKKKGTSRPRKALTPESSIQAAAERLCDHLGLQFIRVPDAAYKAIFANPSVPVHIRVLIAQFLKGLPDMTILKRDGQYNRALCLELKTTEGDTSKAQDQWSRGASVTVAYGWPEVEAAITAFATHPLPAPPDAPPSPAPLLAAPNGTPAPRTAPPGPAAHHPSAPGNQGADRVSLHSRKLRT